MQALGTLASALIASIRGDGDVVMDMELLDL